MSDTFEIVEEEVECIIPEDGMVIMENTLFCQGYYNLPNGISIGADDITLDCNGAFLEGDNKENDGIYTEKSGIEILNCKVKGFSNGVYLDFNSYNSLENLDIFENKQGIVLDSSDHNTVNNSYIHQNNFRGISSYWGDYNLLRDNIFESNGYDGIYLHSSVENILINNELTGDSIIIDGYLSQNY